MKNAYLWLAIKFEIEFQESIWFAFKSKLFERFIYKLVRQNFLETKSYVGTTYNLGRGKFAEIKEIKEISRKSLKNL